MSDSLHCCPIDYVVYLFILKRQRKHFTVVQDVNRIGGSVEQGGGELCSIGTQYFLLNFGINLKWLFKRYLIIFLKNCMTRILKTGGGKKRGRKRGKKRGKEGEGRVYRH